MRKNRVQSQPRVGGVNIIFRYKRTGRDPALVPPQPLSEHSDVRQAEQRKDDSNPPVVDAARLLEPLARKPVRAHSGVWLHAALRPELEGELDEREAVEVQVVHGEGDEHRRLKEVR